MEWKSGQVRPVRFSFYVGQLYIIFGFCVMDVARK
ncbi:hypothetical protein QFZ77_006062 [Paenibacillus sp. V4I3]|nr:hypothetical protein [Paenibacillus sp. V4I3]